MRYHLCCLSELSSYAACVDEDGGAMFAAREGKAMAVFS
jgi:hypothetical protein